MPGGSPEDYGNYTLNSARLLTLPQLTKDGIEWFGDPPRDRLTGASAAESGNGNGDLATLKRKLADSTMPGSIAKKHHPIPGPVAPPAPPPAPPPISSVGVMDVGQGNCNVLIDVNFHPVTYYDVGYPLFFFLNSLPAQMRFGTPTYLGPFQPPANLNVVLSHWDWDHWRLGAVANLVNAAWTIPNQPGGPAAANFLNALGANAQPFPAGAPTLATPNYTVYRCTPLEGMAPAALMNNSGLAMEVWTRFPTAPPLAPPNHHRVLLTADANFNTLAGVVNLANPGFPRLAGITAVHHGSNNYEAPNNLPQPVYAGQGRIAYSYGVSSVTGSHPYSFPGQVAVGNYAAGGWTQGRSTAEGPNIHTLPPGWPPPPPVVRGNVRMGDQTALVGFPGTAFTNFPAQCQLS